MTRKTENILIIIIDFLNINGTWIVHYLFRVERVLIPYNFRTDFLLPMIFVFVYWLCVFICFGLYRPWYEKFLVDELANVGKSISFGVIVLFLIILIDDEA